MWGVWVVFCLLLLLLIELQNLFLLPFFSVRALPFGCGWLGTCCVAQADCCVDHGDSTSVSWGLKSEVPVLYREYIQILLVSLSYDLHSFICLLFVLEGARTHMSPFVERSDDSI